MSEALGGVNGSVRRLVLASFLSTAGDRIHQVALVALVLSVTSSLADAGLVFVVSTLPYLLFGLVSGALVDHFDRKHTLLAMDLVRAVIVLLIPLAAATSLPMVFALLFLLTCASMVFNPAEQAAVPEFVTGDELTAANSLFQVTSYLADLVVFPLGAALVTFMVAQFGPYRGTQFAFTLDAVSYVASALLLYRLPFVRRATVRARLTVDALRQQILAGLRYMWSNPHLRANTVLFVFGPLLLGSLNTLWIGFAWRVSHTDAWGYGLTESATAVGTIGGLWVLQSLARRFNKGRTIALGFAIMGGAVFAVGFTDSLWVAVALAALAGAGNMLFLVPSITLVQQQTPPEMCGRVVGVRHMLTFTAFMISNATAGLLADQIGVSPLLALLGAGMVAVGGVAILIRTTRDAT
ncbi:MAG TPA: MFS transporter [Chloroflexota bacterium]|nr:MFS transporter [Chloroflexota bacterium]